MLHASQISHRIKLRQLNVFIAVVEYGSMAKAAEHLAISQPVISKDDREPGANDRPSAPRAQPVRC
ncbi:LysR family transcriptional regulator [Bradyrhizobium sp. LM6.9]